jgi:hypothetical protein
MGAHRAPRPAWLGWLSAVASGVVLAVLAAAGLVLGITLVALVAAAA